MNNKGITLIELLVVIAVAGILVIALGFTFIGWQGRYRIESQTKDLYDDLMNARARAMQRNRVHFVVVTAADYQIYEDTDEDSATPPPIDADDTPIFTNPKPLEYPSLWAGTVTMNTRGLVSPNTTIQFNVGTNTPDYDCIILFATRINMGQWNGASCDAK